MKKLYFVLALIIFLAAMPISASAQSWFTIDNENIYEGMNRAYSRGYTPTVSVGTATIVLPLTSTYTITNGTITVTPGLGDVSSAPFVYQNYQKNVVLANNNINGTDSTVSSYLVRFDLPLKSDRVNGTYPVVITVSAITDGSAVTQTFTTYVTITDGINPNATELKPEPEMEPTPVNLSLDSQNVYPGMNRSYAAGYSPTVNNGVATIVVPVLSDGYLSGDKVTASLDLGSVSDSPFVYRCYQKDVTRQSNAVSGNINVSSYLIQFSLSLSEDRINGTYPVTVTVQGKWGNGNIVKATYSIYVTITDGIDPNAAEPVRLSIDSQNVYESMDKSFSQGYSPTVADGKALIVLPVISTGEVTGNTLTASADLGTTSDSPFVYRNYKKAVTGSDHLFLVHFELSLQSERNNGVYPVTITLTGVSSDGESVTQSFTVYVTITDGIDPSAAAEERNPVSQPNIIVAGHSISPSPLEAGDKFTATVTLKNLSSTQSVQNMLVTVGCDNADWILLNETNVFFIDGLAAGSAFDIEVSYKTDIETAAGQYGISLNIVYDNKDAQTLSGSGDFQVEIGQAVSMELETSDIPASVNAGDTISLSFSVLNLSRDKVYNVRCIVEAAGFVPSGTAFIGNMEAGTKATSETEVFIGTINSTEGYEDAERYGYTKGTVTLVYEDGTGTEYNQVFEFTTKINEPVITSSTKTEDEPSMQSQWWISVIIGAFTITTMTGVLFRSKKRRRVQYENV